MASCSLSVQGALIVGGGACGCSSSGAGGKVIDLSLSCGGSIYGAVGGTDCPTAISTAGALGDNWVELPTSVGAISMLYLKSSAPVRLRIGAAPAELLGTSGTFPTLFAGGEDFDVTVDGTVVATTFTSGAQSAAQVAAQINQAAIGAGLAFLPAFVQTNGQLGLRGSATGSQGSLVITDPNATIGFASASSATGEGEDVNVSGLLLTQFDPSQAPERIQVSGSALIEVLAAGAA